MSTQDEGIRATARDPSPLRRFWGGFFTSFRLKAFLTSVADAFPDRISMEELPTQSPKTAPVRDNDPDTLAGQRDPSGVGNYTNAESVDACAKVWSIYVSEAEGYDKTLVESWKGDMAGMLIFSGLYSASLTAFLVESYKTLQQDSGGAAVTLLKQISMQLAAAASGVQPVPIQPPDPFEPTTAALICNTLWFISLVLSLTCALLATSVEQWARDFLHKTEMRPSPVRRARAFSFLYFGLKTFKMHVVVGIIPMILHASLFFFFAGLIGFLLPINRILTYLMAGVMVAFVVIYSIITVLPIIYLDCPYRTPLSGILWRLWRTFRPLFVAKESKTISHASMTDAVISASSVNTAQRDVNAVEWTVESLTDDFELLPFVEAIPEAIYGPKGFHRANFHLFMPLLRTPDLHLSIGSRIVNLTTSSDGVLLDYLARAQRNNMCLKALWSLAFTASTPPPQALRSWPIPWFDRDTLDILRTHTLDPHYAVSAYTAIRYGRIMTFQRSVETIEEHLEKCDTTLAELSVVRDMTDDLQSWSADEGELPMTLHALLSIDMVHLNVNEVPELFTNIRAIKRSFERLQKHLEECEPTLNALHYVQNLSSVLHSMLRRGRSMPLAFGSSPLHAAITWDLGDIYTSNVPKILENIKAANIIADPNRIRSRVEVLAQYLSLCWKLRACPYEFVATCSEIMQDIPQPFTPPRPLESSAIWALVKIVQVSVRDTPTTDGIHDVDKILRASLRQLLCLVDPQWKLGTWVHPLYAYIAKRHNDTAILHILEDCDMLHLQSCIVDDLSGSHSTNRDEDGEASRLAAIWVLLKIGCSIRPPFNVFDFSEKMFPMLFHQPSIWSARDPWYPSVMGVVALHILHHLDGVLIRLMMTVNSLSRDASESDASKSVYDTSMRRAIKQLSSIIYHPLLNAHYHPIVSYPRFQLWLNQYDYITNETSKVLHIYIMNLYIGNIVQFLSACAGTNKILRAEPILVENLVKHPHLHHHRGPVSEETQGDFAKAVRALVKLLSLNQDRSGSAQLEQVLSSAWNMSHDWG